MPENSELDIIDNDLFNLIVDLNESYNIGIDWSEVDHTETLVSVRDVIINELKEIEKFYREWLYE